LRQKLKLNLAAASTLISLLSFTVSASAAAQATDPPKPPLPHSYHPFKVPVTKSTEQWSVTMGEAILDEPGMLKSKRGIFDVYSVVVKNNGGTLHSVTVDVYRNEPNSSTQFGLFSNSSETSRSGERLLLHQNFPISFKANGIEVVVSWQDLSTIAKDGKTKLAGRKYKQSFTFTRG
jgi:hypothetical protein